MTTTTGARLGQIHYATDGREILLNTPDGWEVDAPWLWWDGPADGDGTGGPWGNPPPGAELAAPSRYGLTLPAVTRCTQLLAENVAGMPWKTYRGREQVPAPTWITDPQAARLDGRRTLGPGASAIASLSSVEFWAQAITSYLWWGEAILYTPRKLDAAGQPTGDIVAPVYLLHPAKVELDAGRWFVDDVDVDGAPIELDPRELIVVRNLTRPGRDRGLGVIQAHAFDLGFYANVRAYADNTFQRGVPNGYLKSTKPDLDAAQAAKLKRSWMAAHGSTRKSIAVLNATTDFTPLELDPQTTQLLDLFRLQAWQVALMFGVPPSKLGITMGQSNTYSNIESEGVAFVTDSLLPIARKFEAAIDTVLPLGTTLKIDFRQLMRGDTTTRYEAYSVGIAAGFLTVDEVRDAEDLPPLPAAAPVAPPTPLSIVAAPADTPDTSPDTSPDTGDTSPDTSGDTDPVAAVAS
jgi:HK97 family phage portal protein